MPYRVIQWATGTVGKAALRTLIERPEYEVVGVLVYNQDKVGKDAGELVDLPPIGVRATDDAAEILALDADCVLHMPLPAAYFSPDTAQDTTTIRALLASGKNVITTTGFICPRTYGSGLVDRLAAACAQGGTSVYGTGVNPGFVADLLPLVFSALSTRLDHIYVREASDFSGHPSRRIVVDMLGFTKEPKNYVQSVRPFREFQRALFTESIHLVARALGVEIDDVDESDEYEVSGGRFTIAAGTVRPGTVCASRWTFSALVNGRPFMNVELVYKADSERVDSWADPGYAIRIEGRPSMTVLVDDLTHGLTAVAAHAVNSIPAVVTAPPGIRTPLDLPLVTGHGTASALRTRPRLQEPA